MAGRSALHFLQGTIDVTVVVLMVPCDIRDMAGEGIVGPLDAPGLLVDVAGEDHQVNPRIEGWGGETVELGVEV